jgi:predicted AlkP superfamily phosphohydrolase/phosphomutase
MYFFNIFLSAFFSEELEKQKSLNNQLKEELENMSNIQKRPQISWNAESREEMNEKKKAFDESIQRVRQQYFNQQKENVCSDIENVGFELLFHKFRV